HGQTIQIGWSVLTLQGSGEELTGCEPDFYGNPFEDLKSSITTTLIITAQQNDVLTRLGVQAEACLFSDKIVLAQGALAENGVFLERTSDPSPNESGWYIGPAENRTAPVTYEACYVYELLTKRPALLQTLALPQGYLVVFAGDRIEAVLNEKEEQVWRRNTK